MNVSIIKSIAIFASGTGTNAANIIKYFKHHQKIKVALIVTNNSDAGVLNVAKENNIDFLVIEKERFFRIDGYVPELQSAEIDFIMLAGFLWKIPASLINSYQHKIVNIHPALLPKFGGKGMYGSFVHDAVLSAKEKQSGITIHFVDEFYDNGKTIFQTTCPVYENDTTESLAKRIHELEYKYFPKVIEEVIEKATE